MIFLVEDDKAIRELMAYALNAAGFESVGFESGEAMLSELKNKTPSLIMLDIMLPDEDGLAILKKLKSHTAAADIPVIMATAKGTEYDKVIGLDMGADDYLAKPFGMTEMVSRVKAVLRRYDKHKNAKITSGGIELDTSRHTVCVHGNRTELTLKEYEMLCLFMESPGKVFTRDILLEAVWGVEYAGETRTVDVHIATLRTKLGDCGEYIKTVRGVGYKLEELL